MLQLTSRTNFTRLCLDTDFIPALVIDLLIPSFRRCFLMQINNSDLVSMLNLVGSIKIIFFLNCLALFDSRSFLSVLKRGNKIKWKLHE